MAFIPFVTVVDLLPQACLDGLYAQFQHAPNSKTHIYIYVQIYILYIFIFFKFSSR